MNAIARIYGNSKHPDISGEVKFTQLDDKVKITADIKGLPKSTFLGFHIHAKGNCSGDEQDEFKDVGKHYNPDRKRHPNHKGDLSSINTSTGKVHIEQETDRFTVDEIIGKAIILHSQRDDFTSQPAGDAGDKIACGVIREMKLLENESKNPLKDAEEFAKKHQKGLGAFVKLNAGNVEKGIATFNKNMGSSETSTSSTAMSESIEYKGIELTSNNKEESKEDIIDNLSGIVDDIVRAGYFNYSDIIRVEEVIDEKTFDNSHLIITTKDEGPKLFTYVGGRLYNYEPREYINRGVESKMNIREELNKIDMDTCETDLVNMYEACKLTNEDKKQIVALLQENKVEDLNKFLESKLFEDELDPETLDENDYSEEDLKMFANMIRVNSPRFRGDPYPPFAETKINESNIPDNMRFKMWDSEVTSDDVIEFTWITQGEFTTEDSEMFIKEIKRAINALIDSSRFDQPFTLALEVRSRSGYENGHLVIDLDFNRE